MDAPQRHLNLVFDTNVMVNAMVAVVAPEQAEYRHRLDHMLVEWSLANHRVCFTQWTMLEFTKVAMDMHNMTNMPPSSMFERIKFVDGIQARATRVEPVRAGRTSQDTYDQKILSAAAGARADYLISRDRSDIISLGGDAQCRFLTPTKFARQVMMAQFKDFQQREGHVPQPRVKIAHE